MVARRHKKYDVGEASNYVTRKQAMQKLQLNLKDFRRLCVLKGTDSNRMSYEKISLSNTSQIRHNHSTFLLVLNRKCSLKSYFNYSGIFPEDFHIMFLPRFVS